MIQKICPFRGKSSRRIFVLICLVPLHHFRSESSIFVAKNYNWQRGRNETAISFRPSEPIILKYYATGFMNTKSQIYILTLGAGILITFLAYFWFVRSPYFEPFNVWTQSNLVLFYIFLFSIKVTGIVWPPLPGGIFVLGSIPLIGWFNAYLIDFFATLVASSIAYVLGRKYGMPLVKRIVGEGMIEKIEKIKVRKERELETIFLIRMLGGAVVVEVVAYASGLFKIGYKNFLLGTILSHLLVVIPAYYFFGNIFSGQNMIISIISIGILLILFAKFRKRYLA